MKNDTGRYWMPGLANSFNTLPTFDSTKLHERSGIQSQARGFSRASSSTDAILSQDGWIGCTCYVHPRTDWPYKTHIAFSRDFIAILKWFPLFLVNSGCQSTSRLPLLTTRHLHYIFNSKVTDCK